MIVSYRRYCVECDRCHNQSVSDAEFAVDAALDAGGCGWKRTDINRWMCPRCVRDVAQQQFRAQIAAPVPGTHHWYYAGTTTIRSER